VSRSTVTPYAKDTDVAGTLAGNMASALAEKPRWAALLAAFGAQGQDVENALWQLLTETPLWAATGATLDAYGTMIQEPRSGLSDDVYRAVLWGFFAAYASQGSIDDILGVTSAVAQTFLTTIKYFQGTLASYSLQFEQALPITPGSDYARRIRRAIVSATALGVGVGSIVPYTAPAFGLGAPDGSHADYIGGLDIGQLQGEI